MKTITFTWNGRKYFIGENRSPFIVAEAGVNHNGSLKLAKEMISIAKASGADAVKFQSFITNEIATPAGESADYIKRQSPKFKSWYELLKTLELNKKDHEILINECKKQKIIFFSTPYDFRSADMLWKLGVPIFKIASTDTTNIPLIDYIARKGLPLIISTGMSTLAEVREALDSTKRSGNNKIILLQCTANYPSSLENANIKVINSYCSKFGVLAGYSDHTTGYIGAVCAVAMGAVVIEKHFTKNKNLPGPDQKASANPKELKEYINNIRDAFTSLGDGVKRLILEEKRTKSKMQKSLTASKSIKAGEKINKENVLIRRPATGIEPKRLTEVIGKKAAKNIRADRPIRETDILW